MKKMAISILITICFLTDSINVTSEDIKPLQDNNQSEIYGFVLSDINIENKTLENEIFCKIRHLVNDLLREKIPVYWTVENITINISDINFKTKEDNLFEKGTFIVPFTGGGNG